MKMRERMLAVIREEKSDRVPFVQYDNMNAPNEKIWDEIGKDNMGVLRWCGAHRYEHPNCHIEHEEIIRDGRRGSRNTLVTPAGSLFEERLLVPNMGGVAGFAKHYVETVDDYAILMAYLNDITVVQDAAEVRKAIDDLGDTGLPHVSIGRTPFQRLWIEWVSIMDLSMHLADAPQLLQECMDLMGAILIQVAEVVWGAAGDMDIPYVVIPDNITAPLIGEERFRRYCMPYYEAVASRLADKNIPVFVHMDGDLKPLWSAIGESAVSGLDSLSPVPDNDTSVSDAASMWPDMRLLVNFPSSVHLAAPEVIYHQAMQILTQGGHTGHLQIQVSEDTPPNAWRKSFPQIVRAIEDFGAP